MRPNITVEVSRREPWAVVTARGEIDLATVPDVEQGLAEAIDSGGDVILDLSEVGFMDSTGLRAILAAEKRLAADGHRLALVVTDGPVHRLLEVTALESHFPLFDSVDAITP
ncbi:MAG: STAS domain-containing protein [Acidimicrobiia bacterium]|nr:STAS domain-containing protein [Acidimicrobiia bacterium]